MARVPADGNHLGAAKRGQIIQRVLVDHWSEEQAAAAFGVRERQVVRWVAAYRQHGMTSLREADATEPVALRWLCALIRRLYVRRQAEPTSEASPPVILARRNPPNSLPDRCSRWN